jgi:hypothetical protein
MPRRIAISLAALVLTGCGSNREYGSKLDTCDGGRRCLVLQAVTRGGERARPLTLIDMPLSGSTMVNADYGGYPVLAFRPGTCARPGRGRSIQPYVNGVLQISFDRLVDSTFAVELVWADGLADECAQHDGQRDLRTSTSPARAKAHARRSLVDIVVDDAVRLTPVGGGRRTHVVVTAWSDGSQDTPLQLRPGTCAHVARGRSVPLPPLSGNVREPESTVTELAIPFARFRDGPWALEIYTPGVFEVGTCIDL